MTISTRGKAVLLTIVLTGAFLIGLLTDWSLASMDHHKRYHIDRCVEDEVISARGNCVHPDTANFRNGYWYAN